MKEHKKTTNLVKSALFLALSFVLPFLTGQIPQIGSMLCPMHIPVILCGFICGWPYGLAVGLIAPLLRSFTMSMPPMFPTAVCMAFELAVYGMVSGIMYKMLPRSKKNIYVSLIVSMALGRVVWGVAMFICMGIKGASFGMTAFIAGAITNAIPGIIVQIILIPVIIMSLEKIKSSEK